MRVAASTFGLMALMISGESLVRVGVDLQRDFLLQPDLIERLLRQEEIHIDRVERLQGHDLGAGADILADVHGAHAEMACERRPQGFLVHHRLLLGDLRQRILEVGGIRIDGGLAHGLDFVLLLVALVIDLAERRRRLQRFEPADVVLRAQGDQHGAGRDIIPGIEPNFIDDAGNLEGEICPIDGPQAAHRFDPGLPVLHRDHCGRHGLRRRSHARYELLDHRVLECLETEHAAQHDADSKQHKKHAFDHRLSLHASAAPCDAAPGGPPKIIESPAAAVPVEARRRDSTSRRRAPGTAPPCRRNGRPAPERARSRPAAAGAARSTA